MATFEPYEKLDRLAKVEAYHRGFTATGAKTFVADGHLSRWRIQQTDFSDYTPVVDLLHALSYVYQAAQAVAVEMEDCWRLCKPRITRVWQGRVERVIAGLDQSIAQTIDSATLETLTESRGYLHNNRHRMRYDEHRRRGLPITTASLPCPAPFAYFP